MSWIIRSSKPVTSVDEIITELLQMRGIKPDSDFFEPQHPNDFQVADVGIDPEQMAGAIEVLHQALEQDQTVMIFGDYDADGITATAVLYAAMKRLGFQVTPFIPLRDTHGYGISDAAIDEIEAQGLPDVMITVDNGIVAHGPIQRLKDAGVTVIVTDHHQPESKLPPADYIVHTTALCGATVAWMVARELDPAFARELLDLAAIATIADQVPLLDANRSFAVHGLQALRESKRPGLLQLFKLATITQETLDEQTVNYGIAPRINAMGRLDDGNKALRLLTATDFQDALRVAHVLNDTNDTRKDLTWEQYRHAKRQAADQDGSLIIVHDSSYHEGVIGLIAGKLTEEFGKPAIVMSGDGILKGSARSIPGVNIVGLLRKVREELLEVGGHPMAAGFGVNASNKDRMIEKLHALADQHIDEDDLMQEVLVDLMVTPELLNLQLVEALDSLKPFGQQNPEPIFGIDDLQVLTARPVGKTGSHLQLSVAASPEDRPVRCIAWRMGSRAPELSPGTRISIAGSPYLNEWKGRKSVQFRVDEIEIKDPAS